MIYFKSCTRCQGDLYYEYDPAGYDLVCLQCGFRKHPLEPEAYRYRGKEPDPNRKLKGRNHPLSVAPTPS